MIGIVDKLGAGVTELKEGQRVAALTFIGAYSEYIILPVKQIVPVTDNVNAVETVLMILTYV